MYSRTSKNMYGRKSENVYGNFSFWLHHLLLGPDVFSTNVSMRKFIQRLQFFFKYFLLQAEICEKYSRILHVNHAWEPYVIPDSFILDTQFFKENENSTLKSLHMSDSIVYSQICHKYIHIMG